MHARAGTYEKMSKYPNMIARMDTCNLVVRPKKYGSGESFNNHLRFALSALLPILVQYFAVRDTTTGLVGILSGMLGLGCFSLATKPWCQPWLTSLSIGLYSTSEFTMPSVRSILSKTVGPDEKCRKFATLTVHLNEAYLLESIIRVIPGSMTVLSPGLGMAIASGLQIVPAVCLLCLHFNQEQNDIRTPLYDGEASERLSGLPDSPTPGSKTSPHRRIAIRIPAPEENEPHEECVTK